MKRNHKHKKRKRLESFAQVPPGTPPGTVIVPPEAAPSTIRILAYGPAELLEENVVGARRVREYVNKQPVIWVDVEGLGDAGTIHALGELFGVHRLALEDIVTIHQRPKVEQYGEQLFIVARAVYLGEQLDTEQFNLFVGQNFILDPRIRNA